VTRSKHARRPAAGSGRSAGAHLVRSAQRRARRPPRSCRRVPRPVRRV